MSNVIWWQLLLLSFVCCLATICRLVLCSIFGRLPWLERVTVVLAVISGVILTADGLNLLNEFPRPPLQSFQSFPLLVALVAFIWLNHRGLDLPAYRWELFRHPVSWGLFVMAIGSSAWSWNRIHSFGLRIDYGLTEMLSPEDLVEIEDYVAITDEGTRLVRLQALIIG